jgi:thiamine kinase-like enzyme
MMQEKAEQEAMEKVRAAEKVGEEIGAKAAADLIEKQKGQSKEQNEAQVKALQKKLGETSEQVSTIIDNFEKVHKEMIELRQQESEEVDS